MPVSFHPKSEIMSSAVHADALISIVDALDGPLDATVLGRFRAHLTLHFDDVPHDFRPNSVEPLLVAATIAQITSALEFARGVNGHLAIHCTHGKSRSTGIALAILVDRYRDPARAVSELLSLAKYPINPNPGIVLQSEQLLNLPGLDTALQAECPEYRAWRRYWVECGWK